MRSKSSTASQNVCDASVPATACPVVYVRLFLAQGHQSARFSGASDRTIPCLDCATTYSNVFGDLVSCVVTWVDT